MKQKDLLILFISAFILVIAWIIFNVYHKSITSTISQPLNVQIIPINPDFDSATIENLKKRKKVAPLYENRQTNFTSTITPTISSPSGILSNPATEGGILNQ